MSKGKTHTVSSRFNPLTVEQQAKFNDIDSEEYKSLKEWYDLRLNELWYLALGRKELIEAFCAIAEDLKKKSKLNSKIGSASTRTIRPVFKQTGVDVVDAASSMFDIRGRILNRTGANTMARSIIFSKASRAKVVSARLMR
jgi:hypothetical protein